VARPASLAAVPTHGEIETLRHLGLPDPTKTSLSKSGRREVLEAAAQQGPDLRIRICQIYDLPVNALPSARR